MVVKTSGDSVTITHPNNPETSVKILNFGATVFSWKVNGNDKLWLSEASKLDGSRAVRGGIPLVFPRFGAAKGNHPATDKLPQHGFARSVTWEFLGEVDPTTVQYGLGPEQLTPEFAAAWPYDFTLIYTVQLGAETLNVSLSVENTEKTKPFDFNVLFHTYYAIPEIDDVAVQGFNKLAFYDKVADDNKVSDETSAITFSGEVDRIYKSTPSTAVITVKDKPAFQIESTNTKDTVVWNPWTKNAEAMSDFAPKDGFHKMVCVENGSVADFVKLEPGSKWTASVHIKSLL